jgi:hypothetical protein
MTKVSVLEGRITALEDLVQGFQEDLPMKQSSHVAEATPRGTTASAALVIFQAILAVSVSTVLFLYLRERNLLPGWIWLLSSCPMPFGAWLGFVRDKWKVKYYFISGGMVGTLTFVGITTSIRMLPHGSEIPLAVGGFIIGPCIVYTSAAIFGRWASNRFRSLPVKAGVSRSIAERWTPARSLDRPKSVDKLSAIISAVGPLLALIGSLVTAYFTYLGAVAKAK